MEDNFDISYLPNATVFSTKVQTLQDKLPAILDDFKKYYVFYNKNPEFAEYQNTFSNIKGNLETTNSDLFTITNDVNKNTDDINKKLELLNILITKERMKNRRLKRRLGRVENENNGSDEMISNYKEMYEVAYLRNWALFLGIIGSSIALSKFVV